MKIGSVRGLGLYGSTFNVSVEVRVRAARAWIRCCQLAAMLVGERKVERIAREGAWRLARYRIEGGPWKRFDRSSWS